MPPSWSRRRSRSISRRAGASEVWTWSSSGGNGFEIAPATEEVAARVTRGTEIVLHLKKDAAKYLETYEIERIVRAYSDNIQFPIELVPEEGEPRQINSASALWQRPKSELSADDYKEAYKSIAGAFDEPAMTLHYRAEGRQSYAVLLFAPSTKPFDLFQAERKGKVKLYVRRVFIADDAELLPAYLRFIRGVIDSEDLPLNISREMLQNNPQLAQIRKAVTGRVISEFESLGEKEPEAYAKIWDAFGPVLKEGIWEDYERREKLLALSRFTTTAGEKRSLKQYVDDLKPNQTEIYYLTGDSIERLKSNPKLESAAARGIEVLLLTDPVDAFWTSAPLEFGGKPLKSLSQGDVDLNLVPLLDDKAEAQGTGRGRSHHDRGYQGCARRARLRCARFAAADLERFVPGGRRRWPRPHARAAARAAEPGRGDKTDSRDQPAASAGRGDRDREGRGEGPVAAAAGAGADPRGRTAAGSGRLRQPAEQARVARPQAIVKLRLGKKVPVIAGKP